MSFSAHYIFAVLLTIFTLPTSLWAQSAPKDTAKTTPGSISGRVTLKEKGVFGVAVALRKNEPTNAYERMPRAMTDQDGFYRITNVAPGTYEVTPSVPAFVPVDVRESRGKTVLISDGENVENINFTLVRGGVITGRVTDADGRPVIAQQVFIYRAGDFEQRRGAAPPQVYTAGGAPTDDRGIYRIFGLLPGRYKVAAGRGENTFSGPINLERANYSQVFHPDATDQTKAKVIEVGEGTEATDVDIALGPALQTYTIAGRVVDGEKGLPVPNVRLVFQRQTGQRVESANTVANSNAQGEFVKEGMVPGKYAILVFAENTGLRGEPLKFDVIDQDVSGITVKLVQGASVRGVVVLETPSPAAFAKLSEIQLQASVISSNGGVGALSSASSPIGPDGSFLLSGLAGGRADMILISKKGGSSPVKGFVLVRVEHEGVVQSRGITIQEREQLTGVRVVLSYGTATLRGVVGVENGTLPAGARVIVALMQPGDLHPKLRPAPVDARGRFLMEGIPPGTYEIRAWVVGTTSSSKGGVSREITIQDGVTTDIALTIDMSPPPQKP